MYQIYNMIKTQLHVYLKIVH